MRITTIIPYQFYLPRCRVTSCYHHDKDSKWVSDRDEVCNRNESDIMISPEPFQVMILETGTVVRQWLLGIHWGRGTSLFKDEMDVLYVDH